MSGVTRAQRGGTELAYAEITSNQTLISTLADVTGLTITFTVLSRPVMVECFMPLLTQVTSTGSITVFMTDGSNTAINRAQIPSMVAGQGSFAFIGKRLPANTGAYTAKIRAQTSAGTTTVNAAATFPNYIRAYEV